MMIALNEYLINKKNKHLVNKIVYNYHPKTKEELRSLVNKLIKERGLNADLNDIDTSNIKDMSFLFAIGSGASNSFNGDISDWDVSNVTNMNQMFGYSEFTGDISSWDVSNVTNHNEMFYRCKIPKKHMPKFVK